MIDDEALNYLEERTKIQGMTTVIRKKLPLFKKKRKKKNKNGTKLWRMQRQILMLAKTVLETGNKNKKTGNKSQNTKWLCLIPRDTSVFH